MANTIYNPPANSISLAAKFLPILDEIYHKNSTTAILDLAEERVRWTGANTVNLFNLSPVNLGDYSRNNGYVPGKITGTWEAYTLAFDRGRSYRVDVMDNDETLGMSLGGLSGEVERAGVIPEVDAVRFAKYAAGAGIVATAGNIGDSTNLANLIDAAAAQMNDAEVPEEGRILFISNKGYNKLRQNITRMVMNRDGDVNNSIEIYNDMRVVKVPEARFHTACTLAQPSASTDVGGFTPAGAPINFMIIHPSAVLQVMKHYAPRLFSPEQVFDADGWVYNLRMVHDAFVKVHKANGIYLSAGIPATAMTLSASTASITGTGTSTITVSNPQGAVTVSSSNTGVCTAAISTNTITLTGVTAGTATITVVDSIGQTLTITATVGAG